MLTLKDWRFISRRILAVSLFWGIAAWFVLACIVALTLAGCQTMDQAEAQRAATINEVLSAHVGKTLTYFIQTNPHLSPIDFYNSGSERVFIFQDTFPRPGLQACRISITATRIGSADSPDSWRIKNASYAERGWAC